MLGIGLSLTGSLRSSVFSPALLFRASEPGVWFDPSDVANLNWRRNLLTWTEQFDNAVWTKNNVTVSANSATAPNGTTTADLIYPTTTGLERRLLLLTDSLLTNGLVYTQSIYVKSSGFQWVRLNAVDATSPSDNVWFDVVNGVVGTVGSDAISTQITSAGSGWFRISVTGTAGANDYFLFSLADADGSSTATANGTNGVLIWGAQLEVGLTATEYQRITDVNTEVRERFPKATLYQDVAGTTPVTTPGQTVALALDKSKGLVLGPELVTNGDFSSGTTGWTVGTNWAIGSGIASKTAGATGNLSQSMGIVNGRFYRISFVLTISGGAIWVNVGSSGSFSNAQTVGGTINLIVAASGATGAIEFQAGSGAIVTIDNISVKEVPGFHATQSVAASRPTYGIVPKTGRRNLLTRTEEFNDAVWVKDGSTVSANTVASPDGAATADTVTATAASSVHSVRPAQQTIVSGANNAFSVYVKKNTSRYVWLSLQGVNIAEYATAVFDLDGGTSSATQTAVGSTSGTIASTSMTSVGSGWYRLTIVASLLETGCFPFIGLATAATGNTFGPYGTISFSAVGTESVYIWGAQLETGSTATDYQRVGSQFDVTEAGVPSLSYLSFDGVDDFLVTPTITPGTDKAQVFAGVRKLSDGAIGIVAELSADSFTNNGGFYMAAPLGTGASGNFAFWSKGTSNGDSIPALAAGLAPITTVVTGIGNISSDERSIRRNGSLISTNTTDQGTGNYLAYPLYIGMRAGTSLPFNGQLYSLIVRFGPNLDTKTLTLTEKSVGGKTGFFAPIISGVPTIGVA